MTQTTLEPLGAKPLRICLDCDLEAYTEEDLEPFANSKTSKYGKRHLCKKCVVNRGNKWREDNLEYSKDYERNYRESHSEEFRTYRKANPIKFTIINIKGRSKRKGFDFNLDEEYLAQLWDECEGICLRTGVQMNKTSGKNDPYSMSVDRINPEKGYTKENVRLVSLWYNRVRSNWGDKFTLEMCQRVVEHNHQ